MSETLNVRGERISVVPATVDDLPAILTLFEEVQRWLAARGLEGQWGTRPISTIPAQMQRFHDWIAEGTLFAARIETEVVATHVLTATVPPYAQAPWQAFPMPALYIEAFVVSRRHAGSGIGLALLGWAEAVARRQNAAFLRLDCWAANDALCAYYRKAGFVPVGQIDIGTWPCQLFEKRLPLRADCDELAQDER
jgi:GNAT superfamily N-acetyltransferase